MNFNPQIISTQWPLSSVAAPVSFPSFSLGEEETPDAEGPEYWSEPSECQPNGAHDEEIVPRDRDVEVPWDLDAGQEYNENEVDEWVEPKSNKRNGTHVLNKLDLSR